MMAHPKRFELLTFVFSRAIYPVELRMQMLVPKEGLEPPANYF